MYGKQEAHGPQVAHLSDIPYQNENVAAILLQYCCNIYLLPEIPGSKSGNIATIAAIIIQVLAIIAATFYCHNNLNSGNNLLPQLVLATNCCRKHCTCSVLLTHFLFHLNSKLEGKLEACL